MLKTLKLIGGTLLILGGFGLAVGIGVVISALSALIGTALLGGAVILVIILMVKELLDN